MPDLPEEAVQAVAEVLYQDYASEYKADHLSPRDFWFQARQVVKAAAPVVAAQARAQALQDAAAGRVTLEEWATVEGVTVPQRIEDLQSKEYFTSEEVESFFAVLDEPSCCDQVRRQTAEQIAASIEARRCPMDRTFCDDCVCRREDGALARQIGEAR